MLVIVCVSEMDDDQVEAHILRVLRESPTPLKAKDIERKIGNGCNKQAVNRVLHNRLKGRGADITNPGQTPPLWGISPSSQPQGGGGTASPQAPSRPQSSPRGPQPSPHGQTRVSAPLTTQPDPVPQIPDSVANETLYKKREDAGTLSFIPVHTGGQTPPTNQVNNTLSEGNRESPGGVRSIATPGGSNSAISTHVRTPNSSRGVSHSGTPNTTGGGVSPHTYTHTAAQAKDGSPNLFSRTAAKDYSKGDLKKSDTTLEQQVLNNAEVPGSQQPSQLTPSLEAGLRAMSIDSKQVDEGERVLEILMNMGKMTVAGISAIVGKPVAEVTVILMRLFEKGKVSSRIEEDGNVYWTIHSQASGH